MIKHSVTNHSHPLVHRSKRNGTVNYATLMQDETYAKPTKHLQRLKQQAAGRQRLKVQKCTVKNSKLNELHRRKTNKTNFHQVKTFIPCQPIAPQFLKDAFSKYTKVPKHQMIDNHTGIHNIHIRKAQAKPT
jgi:hypothetical protein